MVAPIIPKSGTALDALVWRYGKGLSPTGRALPTGFADLDRALPQQGWFGSGLNELLGNEQGVGEFSLLLPALRQVSAEGKAVLLVNPPFLPYAPALEQAGIAFAHLIIVRQAGTENLYWAAEQALRSKACGAVVVWSDESARLLPDLMLRRLQVAAHGGACAGFLFRPRRAREQPSPAPLRVMYAAADGALELTLSKCRGLSGTPRVRVQPWRYAWAARRLPAITPQPAMAADKPRRPARSLPIAGLLAGTPMPPRWNQPAPTPAHPGRNDPIDGDGDRDRHPHHAPAKVVGVFPE